MSHVYRTLTALLLIGACLLPATASGSTRAHRCNSTDLRYPFMPGGPRSFGVFELRVANGRCATAHRIAEEWMRRFEASFRGRGPLRVPRLVEGFRFTTLQIPEVQAFPERGRKGATTIWFDYRIPNG
jgi:hypothetical protein